MIDPSKHVKIFFKNGLVEEGIVVSWSDTKSIIKSIASNNVLVILNTNQDVVAVKIFNETIKSVYIDEPLEVGGRDNKTRVAKLAELQLERAKMEKERTREMMTTFKNNGPAMGSEHYGIPTRLQQPPNINSGKKTKRNH